MVKEEEYLLTNQEILGGLKAALARGQKLKDAMMTFYQAGYKKEEIEDAARAYLYLQRGNSETEILEKGKSPKQKEGEKNNKSFKQGGENKTQSKVEEEKEIPTKIIKNKEIPEVNKTKVPFFGGAEPKEKTKKVVQKISNYGEEKNISKFRSKAITSVLIIILLVLLGILALVILFKSELINFINSLFG